MRKLLAALCVLSTTSAALAQDVTVESVTAYGTSLSGIWRVSSPSFVAVTGFFSPIKNGPPREKYCRIAPQNSDLLMFCMGGPESATVSVEGDHVHLAWGTMMLRIVLDGALENADHFRGHFQFKLSGITSEDPAFSDARRVRPDTGAPDNGGKEQLLRQIFARGFAAVPHDDKARKNGIPAPPSLGPAGAITYLGQEARDGAAQERGAPAPVYPFSVYLVNFALGERLCGIHQRDNGVVDDFSCA